MRRAVIKTSKAAGGRGASIYQLTLSCGHVEKRRFKARAVKCSACRLPVAHKPQSTGQQAVLRVQVAEAYLAIAKHEIEAAVSLASCGSRRAVYFCATATHSTLRSLLTIEGTHVDNDAPVDALLPLIQDNAHASIATKFAMLSSLAVYQNIDGLTTASNGRTVPSPTEVERIVSRVADAWNDVARRLCPDLSQLTARLAARESTATVTDHSPVQPSDEKENHASRPL